MYTLLLTQGHTMLTLVLLPGSPFTGKGTDTIKVDLLWSVLNLSSSSLVSLSLLVFILRRM